MARTTTEGAVARSSATNSLANIYEVLAVVDDEQGMPIVDGLEHGLALGHAASGRDSQGRGHRMVECRAVGQPCQLDEPRAVAELVDDGSPSLQGQTRLAHAARPDQGDESLFEETAGELIELGIAPVKRRRHDRQVAAEPIERDEWGEVGDQPIAHELPDVLRLGQVTQAMHTKILEPD